MKLSSQSIFILYFFIFYISIYTAIAAPTLSHLDNTTYSEDNVSSPLDDNITVGGTDNFTNGYFEVYINNPTSYDNLTIARDDNASTTAGIVSIVGDSIYVGTGTMANSIGTVTIDNGSHFRADFSNTFYNGNFDEPESNGKIPGWTKVLERVYLDGNYEIADWPTPLDVTWPTNNLSKNLYDNASITDGFSPNISITSIPPEKYVKLETGNSVHMSENNGYGIIRGPVIYSDSVVSLIENDNVSFAWKAESGGDAFDAYAYLLNINNGNIVKLLDETADNDTYSPPFTTKKVQLGSNDNGTYRYVFVTGSFDATGGKRLGGSLGIDNISVESSNTINLDGLYLKYLLERLRYQYDADNPPTSRQISFVIEDDSGDNVTTSSFINIISSNDPPLAYDNLSSGNFTEDSSYSLQLTGFDIDGDNFSYTLLSNPAYGTLDNFDSNNGTLTFTPYDNLSENFIGSDNFSFLTTDNLSENSTTATIAFQVIGVNDPPVATDNLTSDNYSDNASYTLQLSASDVDLGTTLTYVLVTQTKYGTVALDPLTGLVTFTPYDNLSASFFASDNVTFYATDNLSNSTIQTYSFNVLGTNDPPLAYDNLSSGNFTEDSSYSLQLTGFDIDGDNFTYTLLSNPAYGTLDNFDSNNGTLTFTPYDKLSENFIGSDNFSFLTTDNHSENSTTATIAFVVNGQNDPPIADNLTLNVLYTAAEVGSLSMRDPDELDNHSYAIVVPPNFGSITLEDNLTGRFRYQASSTAVVADWFQFEVTDSSGASDNGTVGVNINQVPTVSGFAVSMEEDSVAFPILLQGNDLNGDDLSLQVTQFPANGTLSTGNSNLVYYTPSPNFNGVDEFRFQATDNYSQSSSEARVTITVLPQNDLPYLASGGVVTQTLQVGQSLLESLTVVDLDAGEVLTATLSGPDWLNWTGSGNNPFEIAFTGTPSAEDSGLNSFTLTVVDQSGAIFTLNFSILVQSPPEAPPPPDNETEEPTLPEILVGEETSGAEGESMTLQSNGSTIVGSGELGIELTGSPQEEVMMRIPVPASGAKPLTEIRAVQKLDGTQAIEVDTVNPAATEVTSALLELPPGTQTDIAADGTIQTVFAWGTNEVKATITPRGEMELELVESIVCVDGQPTRVYLPEGARTTVQAQRLETIVTPEEFTQSGVQESILSVGVNGAIETQMPLAVGSQVTTTHIPACSATEATYTGALISELPPLPVAGNFLQRTLTQNADGEVQMILRLLDADNQTLGSPILLPKLSEGSTVEVLEEAGLPVFVANMPLYSSTDNASLSRSSTQQELSDAKLYYVGRDPEDGSAVYLTALTVDAMVQVRRVLDNELGTGLTSIVGVQGSSAIYREDDPEQAVPLEVGETFHVRNSAHQIPLPQGDAIFTFPTEDAISVADLEIRIREAHSVWAWDVETQAWQGYSPQLRRDVLIARELEIPRLRKRLESGQGLWVYLEKPSEVLYPDAPPGALPDTTNDPNSGWRLLGNNTNRVSTIHELLSLLPDNVLALWRWSDGDWQVYTPHADLEADRQRRGIGRWPEDTTLPSQQAYWVQVTTPSTSRSLRVPPHP